MNHPHKEQNGNNKRIESLHRHEAHLSDDESHNRSTWCAECFKRKKSKVKKKLKKKEIRKSKMDKEMKALSSDVSSIASTSYPESSTAEEKSRRSQERHKRKDRIQAEKRGKKSKKSKPTERRYKDKEEASPEVSFVDIPSRKESDEKLLKDYKRIMIDPENLKKTCCYLCAQNTQAIISSTSSRVQKVDKYVQVSGNLHPDRSSMCNKRCGPNSHVKKVRSMIKTKTFEIGTSCPDFDTRCKSTKPKSKRKKFSIFPKVRLTKCPAQRTVGCVTEETVNKSQKRTKKIHCCKDTN